MMKRFVLITAILVATSSFVYAQGYTPGQNIPAPMGEVQARPAQQDKPKAVAPEPGKSGGTNSTTGLSDRSNFDSRANAASDNSTGTAPAQTGGTATSGGGKAETSSGAAGK
jgi:hypothetical protein